MVEVYENKLRFLWRRLKANQKRLREGTDKPLESTVAELVATDGRDIRDLVSKIRVLRARAS